MVKLYRPIIKGTNWALAGLLSLLGFSCDNNEENIDDRRDEYGTPYATYNIKGKVLEEESFNPVPDVQVVVMYDYDENKELAVLNDTVYTNTSGQFKSSQLLFPSVETVKLITSDKKNELLKDDITYISFKNAEFKEDDRWYKGITEKEVIIHLKKEE